MRLAQGKLRHALLSIGEDSNKTAFLPVIQELHALGYAFYATEGTHAFLKKHKIDSILLHKMYKKEHPSLEEILRQDLFDLIINVPYANQFDKAKTDGAAIREWAIKNDTPIFTNLAMTTQFVDKLKKRLVVKGKGKSK
jgi:predicted RNA binding protein YcfA (HicA-like mRNA interferase family)